MDVLFHCKTKHHKYQVGDHWLCKEALSRILLCVTGERCVAVVSGQADEGVERGVG